jgi:uncharacterized protein (DUF1501 family)
MSTSRAARCCHVHRRDLLRGAATALPMVVAGRAYAAPQAGSRLLVVFLRGAYDAANIVAPTGADFYHQARPTIGLRRPDPLDAAAPSPLDADWSLHPALRDSILPLWGLRQLAFIPFAGTDDMSRSHFETQDTIELGQPVGGHRDYGSGFMARLATILGRDDRPIAFTDQLPLCFHGGVDPVPNLALANVGKPIDAHMAGLIAAMYQDDPLLRGAVAEGF